MEFSPGGPGKHRMFVLRFTSLLSACHRDIQAESDDDDDDDGEMFCGGAPSFLARVGRVLGHSTC